MATAGVGQGVPADTASLEGETGSITGRTGVGEAASAGVRVAAGVPGTAEDDAEVGVLVAADTHRRERGGGGDAGRICWRRSAGRCLGANGRVCWR